MRVVGRFVAHVIKSFNDTLEPSIGRETFIRTSPKY